MKHLFLCLCWFKCKNIATEPSSHILAGSQVYSYLAHLWRNLSNKSREHQSFYLLTDTELGHRKRERESPWLLQLLSSSILWPFTHCRSIIARYSLWGKQGNRKTADRSNCWHFSGRFLRQSVKLLVSQNSGDLCKKLRAHLFFLALSLLRNLTPHQPATVIFSSS